jgi:ABC-2 type transport system permease protein
MLHLVPIYRALAVAQLQALAQYRVQIFLWMLFTIIRPVIFLAAWVAVAAAQGGSVGAFSASDFAAYYVALTLVLHFTGFWHAWEFDYEVRMGRLSPKLLRPLHPIHYAVVESAVSKLYTLLGLAPALVIIAWTFGARFTTDALDIVLFVPSLVLAAALRFVSGWAIACLAFWTTRSGGAYHLSDRATFIFGGQIAPLSLMPGILEPLAYALPFGYMLAVPTEILRGGLALEAALLLIGGQVVWLAVSWVILQAAWRAGVRQYTAVGA